MAKKQIILMCPVLMEAGTKSALEMNGEVIPKTPGTQV